MGVNANDSHWQGGVESLRLHIAGHRASPHAEKKSPFKRLSEIKRGEIK